MEGRGFAFGILLDMGSLIDFPRRCSASARDWRRRRARHGHRVLHALLLSVYGGHGYRWEKNCFRFPTGLLIIVCATLTGSADLWRPSCRPNFKLSNKHLQNPNNTVNPRLNLSLIFCWFKRPLPRRPGTDATEGEKKKQTINQTPWDKAPKSSQLTSLEELEEK
jgi:hypothetical protein